MYWRLTRKEFEVTKGEGNKFALKELVLAGSSTGVIAYRSDEPIGWCSVAPREDFSTLGRSRILKPVDEQQVWSIVCLFVARKHRRQGVSRALVEGAVGHCREHGVRIVEAYPVDPRKPSIPDVFAYTGLLATFQQCGFEEVARRSETRPIMRLRIV
jgi:GNAT superfamily N-acetyltransferase